VDPGSILAQVPLFAELRREELAPLAARLRRRRYAKGAVVFLEGDPGTNLCIVETGVVKILLTSAEGKEIVLGLFGAGDFFGELALLDGEPRSADAIAAESSQLLLLERADFLRYLEANPRAVIWLLTVLGQRLRRDAELMQEAVFLDVPARLARVLLRLAGAPDQLGDVPLVIPARLSQAELASMVGTTRESINRWLRAYERRGLIRQREGRIRLLRPAELQKRAR
jgi:CRP/FNR family cyclic AMP-dependent transcriptional regulator